MRQNGRMRGSAGTGAIGSLPGASRGYLPLLPTACVAICLAAGSLYWRGAPPRAPEGHVAAMQPLPPGTDLFRIVPDGEGRVRAPYPLEFEQQFPMIASLPAEAAAPVLPVVEGRDSTVRESDGKAPRRAGTHRPRAVPSLAGVRPPARPDDLKVAKVSPERTGPEPASRTASAGGTAERPASWLPFAPTGRLVTQSMVALGEGVTNAGAAMIELIDSRR
ncbi:hypothetical protein [Methylobacterium platani]|uniref:Uncharacterized protein n=2 Tax=Methylobacterium platani TaxID=427683 RepID=A0A179SMJ2_9HYPH|nr:hypothetical protein [Methylobacterium platani]KMO19212.1 hypothetical protein SQ03_08495 [Methylobacterium platani JCM 14648]OAS27673.1 hypothetical protein A5481_00735 [Methylobacterium platani]